MSTTIEADVTTLNLTHKCSACAREFTKQHGLRIHLARWCDGGRTQRSRLGALPNKATKMEKKQAAKVTLGKVHIENKMVELVYPFAYLGTVSKVMGTTKLTCVIAWTLRKRHSRHRPTYVWIIAFPTM